MDLLLSTASIAAITSLATSLTVALAGHRLTRRLELDRERRQLNRDAAAALASGLRELRAQVARLGRVDLPQADVARAFLSWSAAFDRTQHLLPHDWPHLGSQVRAASGTVFGAVTLSDFRPEMEDQPLAGPDFEWQDDVYTYIEYLLDKIERWGAGEKVSCPLRFDPWLVRSGRRATLEGAIIREL